LAAACMSPSTHHPSPIIAMGTKGGAPPLTTGCGLCSGEAGTGPPGAGQHLPPPGVLHLRPDGAAGQRGGQRHPGGQAAGASAPPEPTPSTLHSTHLSPATYTLSMQNAHRFWPCLFICDDYKNALFLNASG
jgi:hypothetical protein